jgi:hypothetical protein
LYIVHYSNSVKPWEKQQQEKMDNTNLNSLDNLFHMWYKKSQNYLDRYKKEQRKRKADDKAATTAAAAKSCQEQQQQQNTHFPAKVHRMVTHRFKELRSQGKSTQEAMQQARAEFQPSDNYEPDVGTQVAAMFGMI